MKKQRIFSNPLHSKSTDNINRKGYTSALEAAESGLVVKRGYTRYAKKRKEK